jgi:hypothetical protein
VDTDFPNSEPWGIHEAAHHVVARVLSLSYGAIDLDDEQGFCGTLPDVGALNLAQMHGGDVLIAARIISLLSGGEAERQIFGSAVCDDADDLHHIDILAGELCDSVSWPARERTLRRFAASMVQRHRDHITRLATFVSRHGRASKNQIDVLAEHDIAPWVAEWTAALGGEHGDWLIEREVARRIGALTSLSWAASNDNARTDCATTDDACEELDGCAPINLSPREQAAPRNDIFQQIARLSDVCSLTIGAAAVAAIALKFF